MSSRLLGCGVSALILGLLFSLTALAQTYPIRLTRPWKQGDRYRISATGFTSKRAIASVDGKVASDKTDQLNVDFGADATVLELWKNGTIAKEALRINNFVVKGNGGVKQLLAKGTVVVAANEGDSQVFRIDGQAVDKEIQEALSVVISIDSGDTSDDDVFGTHDEKKIGESWPINSVEAARMLRDAEIHARKEDIRGTATIEKRVMNGHEDCLLINSVLDVDPLSGDLDGFTIESGDAHVHLSGVFPIDTSRHEPEQSQQLTMHMRAKGKQNPGGAEIQVDVTLAAKMTARYSVL